MEIELNPQATLSLQMDMPRITRSDMTRMSELLAKYRGVKLTLTGMGFTPNDEVMKQLDGLEQSLVSTRVYMNNVMQALSMPPEMPAAMTGHSSDDLASDVARENAPNEEGDVPRPEGVSDAAKAARAKYRRPQS